jgi:uncharacterized protein (DUF1501 family)
MSYQLPIPGAYRAAPTVRPDRTAIGARPAGVRRLRRTRSWSGSRPESGHEGLHELWGSKDLAIVRGVGYPYPDRSHFRSMAIWQSASPQSAASTGWLGRWLDATTTNPLLALSVDSLVPPMQREAGAASFPIGGLRMPKNALDRVVGPLGKPSSDDDVWRARAARSFADLQAAVRTFGPAHDRQPSATPTTDPDDQENQEASAAAGASLRHSSTWLPP